MQAKAANAIQIRIAGRSSSDHVAREDAGTGLGTPLDDVHNVGDVGHDRAMDGDRGAAVWSAHHLNRSADDPHAFLDTHADRGHRHCCASLPHRNRTHHPSLQVHASVQFCDTHRNLSRPAVEYGVADRLPPNPIETDGNVVRHTTSPGASKTTRTPARAGLRQLCTGDGAASSTRQSAASGRPVQR